MVRSRVDKSKIQKEKVISQKIIEVKSESKKSKESLEKEVEQGFDERFVSSGSINPGLAMSNEAQEIPQMREVNQARATVRDSPTTYAMRTETTSSKEYDPSIRQDGPSPTIRQGMMMKSSLIGQTDPFERPAIVSDLNSQGEEKKYVHSIEKNLVKRRTAI